MPLPGGGATKKRPKNSKNRPKKIALFSLYLLNMNHVNPGGEGGGTAHPADTHAIRLV